MNSNSTLTKIWSSLLITGFFAIQGMAQPTFSKEFTPNVIGLGSVTTLTFTITETAGAPITDLAFMDVLPTMPGDLVIADPASASTTCLNGVVTAPAGGTTISLSGGELGAFQTCFVTVNVTTHPMTGAVGMHTNLSGDLTSSAGNSGTATDDLTVGVDRPSFSKSFSPNDINLGETSTLTFVIDNTANASDLSSLVFTDVLPTGLTIASPSNLISTCGGPNPSLSAPAGGSVARESYLPVLGSVLVDWELPQSDRAADVVDRLQGATRRAIPQ